MHLTAAGMLAFIVATRLVPLMRLDGGSGALNFVLHHARAGGVTHSLALDPQGKCLSSVLLALELADRPQPATARRR